VKHLARDYHLLFRWTEFVQYDGAVIVGTRW